MKPTFATLPSFSYKGINKYGEQLIGDIKAINIMTAKNELRNRGILVKKIKPQRVVPYFFSTRTITSIDIMHLFRQLATMTQAGIPLLHCLDVTAQSQNNKKFSYLLEHIKNNIASGLTLAEALASYPQYFNNFLCTLIQAGEESGTLDIMLDKVARYKEQIENIKKKIKKALTYPCALLVIAFLVTTGLLLFVIPQFESLFNEFNAPLPLLTQSILNGSRWLHAYWYYVLTGLGALIIAFIYSAKQWAWVEQWGDTLLLNSPIIGAIVKKTAIARMARTLSIIFAAGLPLIDALHCVAHATGTRTFTRAIHHIREEITAGHMLHQAMQHTQLFPHMVIQMVAIGEESGTLEKMLGKIADFYEEEVDNALDTLNSLLEPIIVSIIGLIIGGLVLAMYLPIFKLGSII